MSELGPPVKKVKVKCICPLCRRKHKVKMEWVGNGIPPKYCPKCKKSIENLDPLQFMVNEEAIRRSMKPCP